MWTEVATGPEARSVRRWAARVLPRRLLHAGLMLLGVTLVVVAYGRVYWRSYDPEIICFGPIARCEESYRNSHDPDILDIWDAIF